MLLCLGHCNVLLYNAFYCNKFYAVLYRLTKGRIKARQKKMHMIARLLDLPSNVQPCPSPPAYTVLSQRYSDGTYSR